MATDHNGVGHELEQKRKRRMGLRDKKNVEKKGRQAARRQTLEADRGFEKSLSKRGVSS